MKLFQKSSKLLNHLFLQWNCSLAQTNGRVHKNNGGLDMMNIKDYKISGIVDFYIYIFNEFIIQEGKF